VSGSRFVTLFILLAGKKFFVLVRFFRINDPYRLLGVLGLMVAASLALFIDPAPLLLEELKSMVLGDVLGEGRRLYSDVMTDKAPLAAWIFSWMQSLFGPSLTARHVLSLLILFFQVSFFTVILINNKAHHENTYLPGLIFGVLAIFSFDMISFSEELIASTLLLFAINNLLKEVEFRIQRESIIFNLGLYLGLASLVVFSYLVFLPGVLIILAIFTRVNFRKVFMLLYGFLLPHALLWVLYFFREDLPALFQQYYYANSIPPNGVDLSLPSILFMLAAPLLFFLLSLIMLNREARFTRYQSQILQIMFLWLVLSAVQIVISRDIAPARFITVLPPLAYFISHYILLIRRRHLAELTTWLFIASVISVLYLSRYERIKVVDFAPMFVTPSSSEIKDKRILLLKEDWGLYKQNRLATGFLEWRLARDIFENPDYFENLALINRQFHSDPPEVIVDPDNLMQGIFYRLPHWQSKYHREGDYYLLNK
jgi:hypothetical protein